MVSLLQSRERFEQLFKGNEQLKRENELLRAKISDLEARLAQCENTHTPPSLKRGHNRKKDQDKMHTGRSGTEWVRAWPDPTSIGKNDLSVL